MIPSRSIAVFDLGGVLIDWNPRNLYRKMFAGDDAAMERFLANVCTSAWNLQQDAGRSFADACALLKRDHPGEAERIDAWFQRQPEMISGPIPGTVEILRELRERRVPVYALTNWSAETYPWALQRFDFLHWFQGTLVSGEVRLVKPDPRIFQLFLETHNVNPSDAVYIDDLPHNVAAASALGMHGIVFTGPHSLRAELEQLGLLSSPPAPRAEER
jgi:2-haloacid dehalogenase